MIKLEITPPSLIEFKTLDLIHDGIINGLSKAGMNSDELIGHKSRHWNFGVQTSRKKTRNRDSVNLEKLIISSPDPMVTNFILKLNVDNIRKIKNETNEMLSMNGSKIRVLNRPNFDILQEQATFSMISPMIITNKNTKKHYIDITEISDDLSKIVNNNLSKVFDEEFNLDVSYDKFYVRSNNQKKSICWKYINGKRIVFPGILVPIHVSGPNEQIEKLWFTGIGEKTRSGFGCLRLI